MIRFDPGVGQVRPDRVQINIGHGRKHGVLFDQRLVLEPAFPEAFRTIIAGIKDLPDLG
jgi:hypothetical protein